MADWNSHNCRWEPVATTGEQLVARGRHAAALCLPRGIYVVGGNTDSESERADVWCLSIVDHIHSWTKIIWMGDVPSQRTCATLVSFDKYVMLLFLSYSF